MARHPFGGSVAAFAMTDGAADHAYLTPGAKVLAYNTLYGGVRITDLALDAAGVYAVDSLTTSDGSDGLLAGQLPEFYGPDAVTELWLSANGGPRVRALPTDGGAVLDANTAALTAATGGLSALGDSAGQPNGLATLDAGGLLTSSQDTPTLNTLANSEDVNVSGAGDGDVLAHNGGIWVVSSIPGPWMPLALGSDVVAGSPSPGWRFVSPTMIELRGQATKAAFFAAGDVVGTLPDLAQVPGASQYGVAGCGASGNHESARIEVRNTGELVLQLRHAPGWVSLDGILFDVGYNPTYVPATGGDTGKDGELGSGPPTKQTYTKSWTAIWSNTYSSDNTGRGGNWCFQGNSGEDPWGNQKSMIGFDSAAIRSEIEGTEMVKITISLEFPHWWYDSGTAQIGTHNYLSMPSSWSNSRTNVRRVSSSGWDQHTWRSVVLPNSIAGEFADGDSTGITLGPASSSSKTYYGYCYGAYQAAKPYLTITYRK